METQQYEDLLNAAENNKTPHMLDFNILRGCECAITKSFSVDGLGHRQSGFKRGATGTRVNNEPGGRIYYEGGPQSANLSSRQSESVGPIFMRCR